jgi:hypothetical protein
VEAKEARRRRNSVAIGAVHALERGCERVAIFDFDAHHGNGTEEIVRALPGKDKVLFISIHLEDTEHAEFEDNYTFYPASGKTSSILSRNAIINIPITPTWRCPQPEPGVVPSLGLKSSSRSRRPPRCIIPINPASPSVNCQPQAFRCNAARAHFVSVATKKRVRTPLQVAQPLVALASVSVR